MYNVHTLCYILALYFFVYTFCHKCGQIRIASFAIGIPRKMFSVHIFVATTEVYVNKTITQRDFGFYSIKQNKN